MSSIKSSSTRDSGAHLGHHERQADFSTEYPPAKEDARIPRQDVDQERSNCARPAARQRSQAPDGFRRALATFPPPDGPFDKGSSSMSTQGLPRVDRIRRRPDFERVYSQGARISGRFMTVFVLRTGLSQTRLGVAATRKLGSAVVRNRAKRLARELFRRHKIAGGYDIVIVPRRELLDAPFPTLEADYHAVLNRRATAVAAPRQRPGRRSGRRPGADQRV